MTVNPIMLNVNACKKFAWFPKLGSSFRANKEAIEPATIPLGAIQLRKQRSRMPRSVPKLEAITPRGRIKMTTPKINQIPLSKMKFVKSVRRSWADNKMNSIAIDISVSSCLNCLSCLISSLLLSPNINPIMMTVSKPAS